MNSNEIHKTAALKSKCSKTKKLNYAWNEVNGLQLTRI